MSLVFEMLIQIYKYTNSHFPLGFWRWKPPTPGEFLQNSPPWGIPRGQFSPAPGYKHYLLIRDQLFIMYVFQNFLRDLLREAKKSHEVTEDELIQYTDTMLQVFDSNKDGKLQLSEMAK